MYENRIKTFSTSKAPQILSPTAPFLRRYSKCAPAKQGEKTWCSRYRNPSSESSQDVKYRMEIGTEMEDLGKTTEKKNEDYLISLCGFLY